MLSSRCLGYVQWTLHTHNLKVSHTVAESRLLLNEMPTCRRAGVGLHAPKLALRKPMLCCKAWAQLSAATTASCVHPPGKQGSPVLITCHRHQDHSNDDRGTACLQCFPIRCIAQQVDSRVRRGERQRDSQHSQHGQQEVAIAQLVCCDGS